MYINDGLRDFVFVSSLLHGFWDNNRTYQQFIENVYDEFEEVLCELKEYEPTLVYYKKGNKPEGTPTELADIIIFILDYFGGSNPQISVDENFLFEPDKYYKNEEWYEKCRKMDPYKYFLEIRDEAMNHLSISLFDNVCYGNEEFIGCDGIVHSTVRELHIVIKLVLEFCDIYGIDMEKELINKISYNMSRPKDYRKIGSDKYLVTSREDILKAALNVGMGTYKRVDEISAYNEYINNEIRRKRGLRAELEHKKKIKK